MIIRPSVYGHAKWKRPLVRLNFFYHENIFSNKDPFMNKLSINYTPFAKSISSFSGLKIFDDLVQKFEIKNLVGVHLPEKERRRGFTSWNKVLRNYFRIRCRVWLSRRFWLFGWRSFVPKAYKFPFINNIGKFS